MYTKKTLYFIIFVISALCLIGSLFYTAFMKVQETNTNSNTGCNATCVPPPKVEQSAGYQLYNRLYDVMVTKALEKAVEHATSSNFANAATKIIAESSEYAVAAISPSYVNAAVSTIIAESSKYAISFNYANTATNIALAVTDIGVRTVALVNTPNVITGIAIATVGIIGGYQVYSYYDNNYSRHGKAENIF